MTSKMNHSRLFLFILLCAGSVRIVSAFLSLGAEHPNEIYRILEPLAALNGFSVRTVFEWQDGLLSVLPIYGYQCFLILIGQFGIHSALDQLIGLKILFALFSVFPILAVWTVLKTQSKSLALGGVIWMGFWPEWIYRSVRLMD